jgi:hypothetical protein
MTDYAGLRFTESVIESSPLSEVDLVLYGPLLSISPKLFVWYRVLPLDAQDVSQASVYKNL